MKKLLLLALLVSGCSMNTISNASSFLLDIFFISDKCNDLIHKYNNLQDEKKNMVQEYEMMKKNDTISYEQRQDLEDRILRTPLDPMVTLMDDPLRLLRALRFSVTKDFKICEELSNAMKQLDLLDKLQKVVSQERIREEVTKMMKHNTIRSLRIIVI